MRIIIGDRTEQAMKILDIPGYPFAPEELSTKFRSLIKKIHPDINGSDEAKKHSQEVISSYKMLKNLAISNVSCRTCNGTGFVGNGRTEFINCGKCHGVGKIKLDLFNPVIPKGAVL